jgi:hypothetical protein
LIFILKDFDKDHATFRDLAVTKEKAGLNPIFLGPARGSSS